MTCACGEPDLWTLQQIISGYPCLTLFAHHTYRPMFIFGEDQEKMKLNELGMQKLGRQNSCQQAKQIMLL